MNTNIKAPQELWSEVITNIFIGGTDDLDTVNYGRDLPKFGEARQFDSVVSLYAYSNPVGWGIKELRYGFGDGPINQEEIQTLREIADWIAGEYVNAKKIGVRCQAGINRSSLCVALFMIRNLNYKADEAIQLIREKRSPDALFNPDFVKFLQQEESTQIQFSS
jgi:hypothetical protein